MATIPKRAKVVPSEPVVAYEGVAVESTAAPQARSAAPHRSRVGRVRTGGVMIGLVVLLIVAFVLSLCHGYYKISPGAIVGFLGSYAHLSHTSLPEPARVVILNVRLPRVVSAMLVGAALAMSGAGYQGIFRNPLVSPDILGASAGAGFGAALGLLLSMTILVTQLMAVAFGLGAVMLTYVLASRLRRGDPILTLVLTGLVVAAVFSALISAVKYLADPYSKLPEITFWLMGSMAAINRQDLLHLLVPIVLGSAALFAVRWQLNALAFGEDEAQALGVETGRMRIVVIGAATLMTAVCVGICGMIGWVGLLIPHLARSLVGPDYRRLMPASATLGALFLLVVDDVARSQAVEIPIGILTALIGAPVFLILMARVTKGWK